MKKFKSVKSCAILFSAAFLLPMVMTLSSCEEVEEEAPKKPDIEIQASGISISFALDESAKYINIFRKKILPESATEEEIKANVPVNIGEFIPKDSADVNSYTFTDTFLVNGTKYTYSVRYKHEKSFVYTGWSDWPVDGEENDKTPPVTTFGSDAALKAQIPEDSYFEYSEGTKAITFKGTRILHMEAFNDFDPCLCISYELSENEGVKRIFSIKDICPFEEVTVEDQTRKVLLKEDCRVDLRSLLTQDFFDRDIYIDGIIYQLTDSTKPSYDKITWSQLAPVPLKDDEGNALETLKIEYNANGDDSHDYSNYPGTRGIIF